MRRGALVLLLIAGVNLIAFIGGLVVAFSAGESVTIFESGEPRVLSIDGRHARLSPAASRYLRAHMAVTLALLVVAVPLVYLKPASPAGAHPPRPVAAAAPARPGERTLPCPHCREPLHVGLSQFNPLNQALFCRSCSRRLRFSPKARALGIVALLLATAAELLLLDQLGVWRADTPFGIALLVVLFLFVVWSAGLVGSLVCRRFAALVEE
jgi:hypothetical protein